MDLALTTQSWGIIAIITPLKHFSHCSKCFSGTSFCYHDTRMRLRLWWTHFTAKETRAEGTFSAWILAKFGHIIFLVPRLVSIPELRGSEWRWTQAQKRDIDIYWRRLSRAIHKKRVEGKNKLGRGAFREAFPRKSHLSWAWSICVSQTARAGQWASEIVPEVTRQESEERGSHCEGVGRLGPPTDTQ